MLKSDGIDQMKFRNVWEKIGIKQKLPYDISVDGRSHLSSETNVSFYDTIIQTYKDRKSVV